MNNIIKRIITSAILVSLLSIAWILPLFMGLLLIVSLGYILIIEWPVFVQNNRWLWFIVPFYIITPFLICLILNFSANRLLLFAFILIVASFDSGSYIAGKLFGIHLLCPSVSPKKTLEGVIGGFVMAYITTSLLYYIASPTIKIYVGQAALFLICILSLLGDLFESWLKRRAHIKDSGNILPGHGGLLDRFDSYLWATYGLFFIIQKVL